MQPFEATHSCNRNCKARVVTLGHKFRWKKIKTTVLTQVWKTFIKSKLRLRACSTSEALRLRAQYNAFSEMPLHVESCQPDTHLSLHHWQWLVTEVVLHNPNRQSLLVKHMLLHYALQPTYSFLYKSAVCPIEKNKTLRTFTSSDNTNIADCGRITGSQSPLLRK